MTLVVVAGSVTVPVFSLMLPEELDAMLPTNDGNSKSICPEAAPRVMSKVTDVPTEETSMPSRRPSDVGKSDTDMSSPEANHLAGTPRPTMRLPSDRSASNDSSRTMFASEMPQA